MRLSERLGVIRVLRKSERAGRVRKCVGSSTTVAGREAAIGVDARLLAAEVDRGLEVKLGELPLAAPVIDAPELVLEACDPIGGASAAAASYAASAARYSPRSVWTSPVDSCSSAGSGWSSASAEA